MSVTRRAATLPVSFFERRAEAVARELLGTTVISTVDGGRTAGRIVEAEAYLGHVDPASHGYRYRRHAQNESLYAPPGTWYVYLSYGMHWCANLVCGVAGEASAVLLRALEPVEGLALMRAAPRRRGRPSAVLGAGQAVPGAGHHQGPGWRRDARSGVVVRARERRPHRR